MTVLVGIVCEDGVVLGADSAETFFASGSSFATIESLTAKKIQIIGSAVLTATTGAVGLGQRFKEVMNDLHARGLLPLKDTRGEPPFRDVPVMAQGIHISNATLKNFERTMSVAQQQPDRGWGLGALVALPIMDRAELFEFDPVQFHPERKGDPDEHQRERTTRYVSMGSGQVIADPFLAFIRRVFWMTDKPKLSDAKLAVAWTLHQVIQLNTGGVGGDQQIASLEKKEGYWIARELSEGEFTEQVTELETHVGKYRESYLAKFTQPAAAIPKPPTLSPARPEPQSTSSKPQTENGSPIASDG